MEGPPSKAELRREFRQRRSNLTPSQRESQNQAINSYVVSLVQEFGAKSISAFLPFDGEPDLRPALSKLVREGVDVSLPVICGDSPGTQSLEFRHWHPEMTLARSVFGIEEPGHEETMPLRELEVLFIPLVAWDRHGNRLGMGAGYFDRALSTISNSNFPQRIGVAYSIQQAECLRADPWDVRLHEVITENGRFTCTS